MDGGYNGAGGRDKNMINDKSMKQFFFALFSLPQQAVAAFQQSHHHHSHVGSSNRSHHHHRHVAAAPDDINSPKNEEQSDALDRRTFAQYAILTTLSLLSITPDNALAAIEDVASTSAATTPSMLEGELTLSSPPPNRVIVMDDTEATPKPVSKVSKKASDPRFFVAGGASAAISHGITTPIDVVKTKMQSDSKLSNLPPTEAARRIVEAEGPKALTAGLGPTVIGVSAIHLLVN